VRDSGSWKSLDGVWNFCFDDRDEGRRGKWFRGFPGGRTIKVPFTYEYPASGIGEPERHDVVWYQRDLEIRKDKGEGRIFLHFEGCDYYTQLWVNGAFAGEHTGAYARFSFDITDLAKNGTNSITVRAEDSFDIGQSRGKQRWKNENFGCWYLQTTGIWKGVWLEYTPGTRIAGVKMTPVLAKRTLELEVELAGLREGLTFTADISFHGEEVNKTTVAVTGKRLCLSVDVNSVSLYEWGIRTWSPQHPDLYDISFSLEKDGKAIDRALSYFGMREIRIEGARITLNNQPLYQRLILDQGYWKDSGITPPDEQALITDIERVMAVGYNGVRKHQKIEDERFLYWADVKGLLVWSEAAAAYEFTDAAVSGFTREWMEIVQQNYNHPSIITWTPFNESWGIPQIKTDPAQQHFTRAIYHLTKSYDPYRPVICNDGWEHTVSDIITLHDYEERGEDLLERYGKHLEEILRNLICHNKSRSAFAGRFSYRGQPIIISEFGGIAFSNRGDGWGYGNKVDSPEEYVRRFDSITTAIKQLDAVSGFCYTQVTDVQQEINGIMDMERNFKVDPELLREINLRKAGNLH
jgi:beta-galactosidase/beta-glucuronidase